MKNKKVFIFVVVIVFIFASTIQGLSFDFPDLTNYLNPPTIVTQPEGQNVSISNIDDVTLSIELSYPQLLGELHIELYEDKTGDGPSNDDEVLMETTESEDNPFTWTVTPDNMANLAPATYHYYFVAQSVNSNLGMYSDSKKVYSDNVSISVLLEITRILPTPVIAKQPKDTTIVLGQTASLSVELSRVFLINVEPFDTAYRWYYSNSEIGIYSPVVSKLSINPTYNIKPMQTGTTYYKCKVTYVSKNDENWSNSTWSDAASVTTVDPPVEPIITTQPQSMEVDENDEATLSVEGEVSDEGVLSYQWYENDEEDILTAEAITGADSSTYDVPTENEGTTYYYCVLTNTLMGEKATTVSDIAEVIVNEDEGSGGSGGSGGTETIVFTDVSESDWFYDDVYAAVDKGLINGKYANPPMYVPGGRLTIAEAIKLAAVMREYSETGMITLTNGNPWYETYVEYCGDFGIIGYDEYDGRYNDQSTRAQYAVIFANALDSSELPQINEIEDGDIPDVSLSDECGQAVYKLYRAGILQGNDQQGTFAPTTGIKRSEVAAILSRMMDSSERKTFTLD